MSTADIIMQMADEHGIASTEATAQILAILAGEDGRAFGKAVRFTVEWPDGVPFGKTPEEFQQWCAEQLAETRGRQERLIARVQDRGRRLA